MRAEEQILELFRNAMPKAFRWHEREIKKIIAYYLEREEDDSVWSVQSYAEDVRMEFCTELARFIKYDVIEKGNTYMSMHLQNREPKNEYEKGVFSCLGVIYHLNHCMNPG